MARNNVIYSPTVNNYNSTLNGAISNTATTINLNSVTGLQNAAGILVIDRVDTSGNLTPTKQEWIYFTGVSGNAVTLPSVVDGRGVGGSTAQSHSDGSIVEAVMDVSAWGGLITSYVSQHADAGTHTAITGNTVGLSSNASVAGMTFTNRLSVASNATISGSLVATNLSILSLASIADNAITANSLATNCNLLGYAQFTAGNFSTTSTSPALISGTTHSLQTTVTIPSGGRKVRVKAYLPVVNNSGANTSGLSLWDIPPTTSGYLQYTANKHAGADGISAYAEVILTPSPGAKTYRAAFQVGAGTGTIFTADAQPAFILCELI